LFIVGRGIFTVVAVIFNPRDLTWTSVDMPIECMSDRSGWDQPEHYLTFSAIVVGREICVCARGYAFLKVGLFDPTTRNWRSFEYVDSPFLDVKGWKEPQYYLTIRTVCIKGMLYVVGRGAKQICISMFDPSTIKWTNFVVGENFMSDKKGWNQPQYYTTFNVIAVNDELCIFGRGPQLMHFALCNPNTKSWRTFYY
jgi:hypothetical protein